jgi:hypothetical protein
VIFEKKMQMTFFQMVSEKGFMLVLEQQMQVTERFLFDTPYVSYGLTRTDDLSVSGITGPAHVYVLSVLGTF